MTSSESSPEHEQIIVRPSVLQRIGDVALFGVTCVGLAASIYVTTEALPSVPRAILSAGVGLTPFSALGKSSVKQ